MSELTLRACMRPGRRPSPTLESEIKAGLALPLALAILLGACSVQAVSLDTYVEDVRAYHPVFTSETLSYAIEFKKREALQGDEDWSLTANPSYTYDEPLDNRFAAPDETKNLRLDASLGRRIWSTGGRLGFTYIYNYNDSEIAPVFLPSESDGPVDITGPSRFFDNAVSVSYTHPLWRNARGTLDRLESDLQEFTALQTLYGSEENLEDFVKNASLLFVQWTLLDEQKRIADERLALAEEELADTKKKLDLNLVEKVNLHRAEDAVIVTRQTVKQIELEWRATQIEIALLAGRKGNPYEKPEFNLYETIDLPDADAAVATLTGESRAIKRLDARLSQIARELEGTESVSDPALDVVLSGGLKDGAESYSDSTDFERPNVGIALVYQYPLGNSGAAANRERAQLERARTIKIKEDVAIDLESAARGLLIRLSEWLPVLELNRSRIKVAADKTHEEARLYEQGRNELTFVIQSRDAEARAKLSYAENAAAYQRLVLEFRALTDALFVVQPAAQPAAAGE